MTAVASKPRVRVGTDGSFRGYAPQLPALSPGRPQVGAAYMQGGSHYDGASSSPFFFGWTPALRESREDVRQAYLRAAARVVDAIHNSGWLAGMVRKAIASSIGTGLMLAAKPDAQIFGGDRSATDQWAQRVESRFGDWANCPAECDASGKHTLGQQTDAAMRSYLAFGEVLALLPLISRPESQTQVKLKLLPPHKLVQDSDGVRLFQGVFHDDWDFPVGYRIMMRVGDSFERPVNIPASDSQWRRQVLHIFNGEIGTVRGISEFTSALKALRQFDQLADTTLSASLLQKIFAATVTSDAPTADILSGLQDPEEQGVGGGNLADFMAARLAWQSGTSIDLGRPGKIAHLFPGEKLNFNTTETPFADFKAFANFLMRELACCAGMTFEEATGDYAGATYASINMASAVNWPIVLARRQTVAVPLVQPVYEAWLEEDIARGRTPFPGGLEAFRGQRREACRAFWRGPPKPQGDWLKAAKAYEILRDMGVITDEQICAELGSDWQDVMEQRARERDERKRLGLKETDAASVAEDTLANQLIAEPDNPAGGD